MKTEETEGLEKAIRNATHKMGVFGCFEVTLGSAGSERVDYITYDTKKIWRCYEIKVSKSDFNSPAAHSFVGNYNYYVMTAELYEIVKNEVPSHIGVYVGSTCVKRAKKQELGIDENLLKDCMIRSLYRDSDKLYQTKNEHTLNRLKTKIRNLEKNEHEWQKKYNNLYLTVMNKYGRIEAKKLDERE